MHGLNSLITSGKVFYLGISDTPAWVVVKANDYARANGLRPFSVYQGKWNMGFRDMEREVLPMCRDQGMGIVPWGTMGSSKLRTAEKRENDSGDGRKVPLSDNDVKLSETLEEVASRKNVSFHALVCIPFLPLLPSTYHTEVCIRLLTEDSAWRICCIKRHTSFLLLGNARLPICCPIPQRSVSS